MNETEQSTEGDLDLNALAEAWMGSPAQQEETPAEETPNQSGEGEEETPQEAPNGSPTQQVTITPEQEDEIFTRRLNAQLARAREAKAQKDLQELLANGSSEDIAEWTRNQIAENQQRQQREALEAEAAGRTAIQMIEHLLDDEFVGSLTPEEASTLLPVEQGGKGSYATDREFIKAINDMRAAKARSGTFDEQEVERRVQERLKTTQNVQRGQQFSQSSPTMTPSATAVEDRHAGKDGQELKDSLWAEAMESWDRSE